MRHNTAISTLSRSPRYGGIERRVTRTRFRRLCSDARVLDAKAGGRVVSGDMDVIVARALSGDLSLAGQPAVG